ncbi:hypothetical protein [Coleofasciculus sp. FACHB-SPT9]
MCGKVPSITLSGGFQHLARSLLLSSLFQILRQSNIHPFPFLSSNAIRFN